MIVGADLNTTDRHALVLRLERMLADTSDRLTGPVLEEVAAAIIAVQSESGDVGPVSDDKLRALAVRALASAGHERLALRTALLGSDLARCASSIIPRGGDTWILDLAEMRVDDCDCLEMALVSCVDRIIDSVAPVWDASAGRGAVGLRNLRRTSARFSGGDVKRSDKLAREIEGVCRSRLARLHRERRWQFRPQVLRIDYGK